MIRYNAVLVPLEPNTGRILVQDRRNHKPPPWGFFGGAIEAGETPLQAVLREAEEELTLTLAPDDLTYFGEFSGRYGELELTLHAFLWPFDGDLSRFVQREGVGTELVTAPEMLGRTEPGSPDHALTLGLKTRYSTPSRFSSS